MARRGWVDDRAFPGNSQERLDLALNLKEGLTPSGVVEDWGDYESDYRIEDLDDSQASSRVEGEVGYSRL